MCVFVGMTVSALRDGSGISVRSVVDGGAISKDGRLKVGDAILAFNGEFTTNRTSAQARAMLRRHSLIGPELRYTHTHVHYYRSECSCTILPLTLKHFLPFQFKFMSIKKWLDFFSFDHFGHLQCWVSYF